MLKTIQKMKRSGKTYRAEPTDLSWIDKFPGCAELSENASWLIFFKGLMDIMPKSLTSLLSVMTKILYLLIL